MNDQLDIPKRPIVRYHGGKWLLAPWILSHFPKHRVYVEPFGGAASVLLQKARSYAEVYNDMDGEIVNLFRVVRDHGEDLRGRLELTPFSRVEYKESFEVSEDPIEQARRTVIRAYMGFGSNSLNRNIRSGFRSNSNRSGTTPAHDWANFPDCLSAIIKRLQGVVIENRNAIDLMQTHDSTETLHYCDPPYVHATRQSSKYHGYNHEMTDQDHHDFSQVASRMKGAVIVSGYDCPLYQEVFSGWKSVRKSAHADGALDRTEVLWFRNVTVDPELFSFQ